MARERLIWLDTLKGCLILVVIFGHAIQYSLSKGSCESNYLWNLIYSFHMPAFMAASGFVNYRPDIIGGGFNTLQKKELSVAGTLFIVVFDKMAIGWRAFF